MSHFCFCLWFLLAANWRRSNWMCEEKSHDGGATSKCQSDSLVDVKNSQNGSGGFRKKKKPNYKIMWRRYNGHLEQPHSRAVSISSEYEVPSVQRKTTFLLLLLVTPQQTPAGAAAWQDREQSMRGILPVDVHVLNGWWRFSCSLTISPWHVSSGH